MLPPLVRLAIAGWVLLCALALVATDDAWQRVHDEPKNFLGQPCREASGENVSAATLLTPAAPVAEAEGIVPLPTPDGALGGEASISGPDAALAKKYEPILNVAKARTCSNIAANVDFHEGDFEHVTVHLRPRGEALVPTAVTMARRKGEDKPLPWDDPKLQLVDLRSRLCPTH